MAILSRVTQTTDRGVTKTTYEIGRLPTAVTVIATACSIVAAVGSFGNFLVNLGAHRDWSWLILH
jgi:hypothetical protein